MKVGPTLFDLSGLVGLALGLSVNNCHLSGIAWLYRFFLKKMSVLRSSQIPRLLRAFSTEANTSALITPTSAPLKVFAGGPPGHLEKKVRVFKPANSVCQSQPDTERWRIDFGAREKWLNPLMGWTSTRDTDYQIGMTLKFETKEEAIMYCDTEGWEYTIEEPRQPRKRPKNYAGKYAWKGPPK